MMATSPLGLGFSITSSPYLPRFFLRSRRMESVGMTSSFSSSSAGGVGGVTGNIDLHPVDSKLSADVDLTDKVHLLPCCIRQDGPCPVSHYFKPRSTGVEVDGLKVEEAFFRGRRLQGATIPLPDGYCGYVLGKKDPEKGKDLEEDSNDWESRAEFHNITYWNHDDVPSQDDPILRCFHWFAVADALHKPVTAEDLVSSNIHGRS